MSSANVWSFKTYLHVMKNCGQHFSMKTATSMQTPRWSQYMYLDLFSSKKKTQPTWMQILAPGWHWVLIFYRIIMKIELTIFNRGKILTKYFIWKYFISAESNGFEICIKQICETRYIVQVNKYNCTSLASKYHKIVIKQKQEGHWPKCAHLWQSVVF